MAQLVNTTVTGTLNITGTTNLMPIGSIVMWTNVTPPDNFLICDGTSYAIVDYGQLFNVIQYTYGGSGANFSVPNLVGKHPMGKAASGLGANLNDSGGSIDHTHTSTAAHTHTMSAHTHTMDSHTHTMNNHTHTMNSHTHTMSSHTHTMSTHTHTTNGHGHTLASIAAGATVAVVMSGYTYSHATHVHTLVGSVSDGETHTLGSNNNATAANNSATAAPNTPNTSVNNNATTGPNTNTSGTNNNATGASLNTASGVNNAPYMSLIFVIRST